MSIPNYIKELLPTFGRKDVRERINTLSGKITEVVAPMIQEVSAELNEGGLKSEFGKRTVAVFHRTLPSNMRVRHNPTFGVLAKDMENAIKVLSLISDYVDKNLADSIVVEGLTYQKASVLRLLEALDFHIDYTSRYLTFLVGVESEAEGAGVRSHTKAELNWLNEKLVAWVKLSELFFDNPKNIFAAIESIPEVLVNSDAGEIPALAGGKADPLQLGIIPIVSDIFHFVGIRKADYELDRWERCKKELRFVNITLENLRQKRAAGHSDARNEALIEGYARELAMLHEQIASLQRRFK